MNRPLSPRDADLATLSGMDLPLAPWLLHEIYDEDIYRIHRMVKSGLVPAVIWDIGANIGLFSRAARRAWPEAEIHSWEPNPRLTEHLQKNAPDAFLHVAAASSFGGKTVLHTVDHNIGGSFIDRNIGDAHEHFSAVEHEVECEIPWDTAPAPDLLKLDCEGSEYDLLAKMPVRPLKIVAELHGPNSIYPLQTLNRLRPEYLWEVLEGDRLPMVMGTLHQ